MKRNIFILWLLMTIWSLAATAQTRRALLVGISNYHSLNKYNEWNNINGVNDVNLITPVLKAQGFNIQTLIDNEATYKNIIKELEQLSRDVTSGDIIYIHFSMHGQPFDDGLSPVKGDEDWDESLVPIDAKIQYDINYLGQNHLVDDEINLFSNKIRKKLGTTGLLYVVVDACHSGGASKMANNEITRGSKRGFSKNRKYISDDDRPNYYDISTQKGQSPVVFLEACQGKEVNKEIYDDKTKKHYGPLSFYVYQTLRGTKLGKSTQWIYKVKKQMGKDLRLRYQHMRIESSVKQ